MAVTARRPSLAVFMGRKEVTHASSSSRLLRLRSRSPGKPILTIMRLRRPTFWSAMAELAEKETKEHSERLNDQIEGGENNIWGVIST
jgi:hypothetical protein